MNLDVLFEVGGCGETFTAFIANEGFLLFVDALVTV